MKIIPNLSLLFCVLLFTQCDETRKVIKKSDTESTLSGNYSVQEIAMNKDNMSNLSFSINELEKSIRGKSSCNSFFGNLSTEQYNLSFSDFAITERYCEEDVMTTERMFLKALNDAGFYTLQSNVITLYSKLDKSVLLKASKILTQEN